ncbi:glycosyltransferase [Rhizobium sp. LEGMi135b]
MAKNWASAIKFRRKANLADENFDAKFYRETYPDLRSFKNDAQLFKHYLAFGAKEGRHANLGTLLSELELKHGLADPGFVLQAYKTLNADLLQFFHSDAKFLEHYFEHGRGEGRPYKFDSVRDLNDNDGGIQGTGEPWREMFSVSHFLSWASEFMPNLPTSRDDAIIAFRTFGIDRLCPLNFDYAFDPEFYRIYYSLSEELTDVELYRDWLETGIVLGRAPNEALLILPLLGGQGFPNTFDWKRYSNFFKIDTTRGRSVALFHLFEEGFEQRDCVLYLGDGAADIFYALGNYFLIRQNHVAASRAFSGAIDHGADRAEVWHLLGDSFLGAQKEKDAQVAFSKAISFEDCPIWSYIHLTRLYSARADFQSAFDVLKKGREKWAGSAKYRDEVRNCIGNFFNERSKIVKRMLTDSNKDERLNYLRHSAERVLLDCLDRTRELVRYFESFASENLFKSDGHIVILGNHDLKQCTYYRIEQKKCLFEKVNIRVEVIPHTDIDLFARKLLGARAVIFYRVPAFPTIMQGILTAQSLGIPTYYEVDDLIFDSENYPDTFRSYEGQISLDDYAGLQYGTVLFRYAMAMCDFGIASTTPLAHEISKNVKSGRCILLRNGLDDRNDPQVSIGAVPRPERNIIRIFYGSGTKAHNEDFNLLAGRAILNVMKENLNVHLVLVGHLKLSPEFDAVSNRVMRFSFVDDIQQYWSILASCDINIAPLNNSVMSDCKSEIKWLEAAVFQIPSVVSATRTYQEVLEQGIDGLLANSPEDWYRLLSDLVSSHELRRKIGAVARQKALALYSVYAGSTRLLSEFGEKEMDGIVLNACHGDVSRKRKKVKILVCNVFFTPQSIGGATRVVEDNVNFLVNNFDDIEIVVFCTDEGIETPGQLRFERQNSVLVIRVSTPYEVGMDRRPFNEDNAKIFGEVLDIIEPDIVHFHCIQRLTASIVETTTQRGIPFFVTLHDAWWISDYQFLMDEDGFSRLPSKDALADLNTLSQKVSSLERRQRLGGLLSKAEVRLSVSSAFASIYNKAGIEDIAVNENGASFLDPRPPKSRADGRVSMGHIGGRAFHKGAFLIEAVLRQGEYPNLHLTMIDGRLHTGQKIQTFWGSTPVTLCGPYPQNRISDLYAELDVLLAPSLWPESYGLVAREAASCGIWVVASTMGAIGEGIRDGENGFLIDVSHPGPLKEVFLTIDKQPNRFRGVKNIPARGRSSDDQARELRDFYFDIISRRRRDGLARNTTAET